MHISPRSPVISLARMSEWGEMMWRRKQKGQRTAQQLYGSRGLESSWHLAAVWPWPSLESSEVSFLPHNVFPVLISSPFFQRMTHLKLECETEPLDRNSLNILLPKMTELHTSSAFPPFVKYWRSVISTWVLHSILFYLPKKYVLSIYLFPFLKFNLLLLTTFHISI